MAYKFTNTHQEYLLQMLEYYYKKSKIKIEDEFVILDNEKTHWFEFVSTELADKILKQSIYFLSNFGIKCIQLWPNGNLRVHPIDYLYEKYNLVLDKQSFHKKTEHAFVEENEARVELKEKRAKDKIKKEKENKN